MITDAIPSCARRFFDIAEALCRAVANAIRPGFIEAAMAMLVIRRIQRVRGVLLALEARFLAGTLVRHRRHDDGLPVVRERRAWASPPATRFPRRFAWLCPLVPADAACYAEHLRVVLAEPGMVRLLAECPQAVRAVRPICRMLGIELSLSGPPGDDEPLVVSNIVLAAPAIEAGVVAAGPRLDQVMSGQAWTYFIPV